MRSILFVLLSFITLIPKAQDFGIGTWRDHLPYSNVTHVTQIDQVVYAATPYAIYSVDLSDNTITRYTKINLLSDFSVTAMAANNSQKTLVVGYESGNVDLIKNERVTNISAILSSSLTGDLKVYNIHCEGQYAYLACGFGIVVIDVKKQEVKDTYIIGNNGMQMKVNDVTLNDTSIFAATDYGIKYANRNAAFLSDYNQWNNLSVPVSNKPYSIVAKSNNYLIANLKIDIGYNNDTLYFFNGNNWDTTSYFVNDDFNDVNTDGNEIIVSSNGRVNRFDQNMNSQEIVFSLGNSGGVSPNAAFYDGSDYWIADRSKGLNKAPNSWSYESYLLSGPYTNEAFALASKGDMLYVAAGRTDGSNWNNTYNWRGVFAYDQYDWKTYNFNTFPEFTDSTYDVTSVAIDPKDENHIFINTFNDGVVEMQDGQYVDRYSFYNSSLQVSNIHGNNQVKVAEGQVDNNGVFWAANSFVNNPLSVYSGGEWKALYCGASATDKVITDIYVDQTYGYIWMAIKSTGLLVYNYNSTPLDETDDEYKLLTTAEGSGKIPNSVVNDISEDRNGQIWIGTDGGPAVFYNPTQIFSGGNYDAQQVLIEQDGVVQILLETEPISAIKIDGGNRKWFSSASGGLFLMSADATEMIHTFTSDNSPLFTNEINDLAINENTGELYIATALGIQGFKSDATEPQLTFDSTYAYPNPVRPDYTGPIAIKGLMDNSSVRITDASGNFVFSTQSIGGEATWNGINPNGERAATGVYYVFVVDEKGQSKAATKILFIN